MTIISENGQPVKGFAIERPNGSIYLELFNDKHDAYQFAEEKFHTRWASIQRTHKLKIVKVIVEKQQWQ